MSAISSKIFFLGFPAFISFSRGREKNTEEPFSVGC